MYLLGVLRLIFKLSLDLLEIHFQVFFRSLKILLLLLDIGFFPMDHFLKPAHRMQEFLRQVHHSLAVLTPKIFENLSRLYLHRLLLAL